MRSQTIQKTTSLNIEDIKSRAKFHVKDPGSAATHGIALAAAIILTPILMIHKVQQGVDWFGLLPFSIFMVSMILLYGASTTYHTFDISQKKRNLVLKKIDHMMIFVLIAGSYTPVCIKVLQGAVGIKLLVLVWGIAIAGMILKACWVTCPKWFSSIIYIAMGWVCLLAMPQLIANLTTNAFLWLLAGGIFYTVGGVIYAMKFPVFGNRFKNFGCHELFHVFVMVGSLCHYMMVYLYL